MSLTVAHSGLAEQIGSNTPELLKSLPQWVMWRYQQIPGKAKPRKPPFQPGGRVASVDDPGTWSSYGEAIAALRSGRTGRANHAGRSGGGYDGIGLVLQGGMVVIDLDNCLREVDGVRRITRLARRVYEIARSYTEVSPSGKGLHIFLRGHLPEVNGQPQDGMKSEYGEMYERKRYITMTGERIGNATEIRADQEAIHQIYALLKTPEHEQRHYSFTATDAEVIRKAEGARNGARFTRLYNGDMTGYRSRSEAIMGLVAMLAYWTNRDAGQIERIFKDSPLYRLHAGVQEKWSEKHRRDGATYGQMTIEKAVGTSIQF